MLGARRKGADGEYGLRDIKEMYVKQRGLCVYCDEPLDEFHIDHRVAISRGGSNWPGNLQLTCVFCNLSKRDGDRPITIKKGGAIIPYEEYCRGRADLLAGDPGPLPAHGSFI